MNFSNSVLYWLPLTSAIILKQRSAGGTTTSIGANMMLPKIGLRAPNRPGQEVKELSSLPYKANMVFLQL